MQYRKYNHNAGDSKPQTQLAIEKFAEMMIARMEEMKESHWKKGWIDGYGSYGLPQNIVSGTLNGGNSFFLQLDTAMHGYKMPLYMTFLQAQNMGLRINKGAESMPVIFWDLLYKDQNGKRIDKETLDAMTREERKALDATHSTGSPERLNRVKGKQFGDTQYGHEEYVAEMTAAVVGNSLGFDKRILDNNTAYIQGWIQNLRENPKVILGILSDVNKASSMLLEKIDQQKIAIGETPILGKKDAQLEAAGLKFENAAIVKQKNGEFAARASVNGTELEMKPVAREIGIRYFSLPEGKEKQRLLTTTLNSSYASDINRHTVQRDRTLKLG